MSTHAVMLLCLLLPGDDVETAPAPNVPEGVIVHTLPKEDLTLMFVEAAVGMTVAFQTESGGWFEEQKMYIGDGTVAARFEANNNGIWLQGKRRFYQADKFPNGSLIKLRKGYKRVNELKRGDVYMILSGVTFVEPGMLEAEWMGTDAAGRQVSLSLAADKSAELAVGDDVRKGTYTVAWYKQGPSQLDFDFGDRGKLKTIMQPNRERLRIEFGQPGEKRPSELTSKAVVLTRRTAEK